MKHLLLAVFVLVSMLLLGVKAQAAFDPFPDCKTTPSSTVCQETDLTTNPQNAKGKNSIYGPGSILAQATTIVSILIGIASVIVIIIAGIKFALSGGEASAVNSARNTILYAVIGLAIAMAAQALVIFVINKL